ncbi:unnamed protein product [Phytophthora lilii]|uniref:Unnamed protein product n=1 Tax=Phytophthora lilii TaxID=2077276 RepID=A0A9W6YEX9_9STRA|nr:unnamed protein product [Phytophthora lilii]
MQLLSQPASRCVKRWFYQQNLRADTSAYISQSIPETLQDTIEYAQRFEDSRKQSRPNSINRPLALQQVATTLATSSVATKHRHPTLAASPATAASPPPGPATTSKPIFVPTCHKCGVQGHKAPDCPSRGNGATQNS